MKRLLFLVALVAIPAQAQHSVTVTNLTAGIYFTPLLVAAHDSSATLFDVGTAASAELQAMAEGGDISGLSGAVTGAGGMVVENPAEGLLGPGASTTFMVTVDGATHLSAVAMMLPTNDGFIGLDDWAIPTTAGTHMVYLNAYDAGTEANDEIINGNGAPGAPGIPVAPGGDGGTNGVGVASAEAMVVHIHPGNVGDEDSMGGASDVDSRVHRWLNPVAMLTITVAE